MTSTPSQSDIKSAFSKFISAQHMNALAISLARCVPLPSESSEPLATLAVKIACAVESAMDCSLGDAAGALRECVFRRAVSGFSEAYFALEPGPAVAWKQSGALHDRIIAAASKRGAIVVCGVSVPVQFTKETLSVSPEAFGWPPNAQLNLGCCVNLSCPARQRGAATVVSMDAFSVLRSCSHCGSRWTATRELFFDSVKTVRIEFYAFVPGWKPAVVESVGATNVVLPKMPEMLIGQGDILKHLGLADDKWGFVLRYSKMNKGPIVVRKGAKAVAKKDELTVWWAAVGNSYLHPTQEIEKPKLATHRYGRTGVVVPEISGHVKNRKAQKASKT